MDKEKVKCILCGKIFNDDQIIWDDNSEPLCPYCKQNIESK